MPSKIITLTLSKELLKRFPHERSEAASTPSTSAVDVATPSAEIKVDTDQEMALKRKGVPGPKPGQKRSAAQMEASTNGVGSPGANAGGTPNGNANGAANGVPKPRGKPGPKKKMKVDGVNGVPIPVSAPKLNPKANQGAINANLRALDRSGAPCRRWDRTGFRIKSFTGIVWSNGSAWSSLKKSTPDASNNNSENEAAKSSVPGTPAGDRKSTPDVNGHVNGGSGSVGIATPNGMDAGTPMTGIGLLENGTSPAPAGNSPAVFAA